ncbi:hypothetical protein VNO77_23660 [Canavalia gladiata]|uniref:protein-serine/threonine phosphatase n=1 Tax=Canavalia gladiata TaxID=3824 RepID=A0AAN9L4T6_CANGL
MVTMAFDHFPLPKEPIKSVPYGGQSKGKLEIRPAIPSATTLPYKLQEENATKGSVFCDNPNVEEAYFERAIADIQHIYQDLAMVLFPSLVNGLARTVSLKKEKSSRKDGGRKAVEALAMEARKNELILSSSGIVKSARTNNLACLFTKNGQKGVNQDCFIVWEEFGCQEDTIFCGIFDGHGPWGHLVAKRVRKLLPASLLCNWQENLAATSLDLDFKMETDRNLHRFDIWKQSYVKTCAAIDQDLKQHTGIYSFQSGTTALTIMKQGEHLIIANVGDSRAVLATTSEDGTLTPVQLTTDLKPNLPKEAERIMQSRGRVFCLEDEPGVYRIWMPNGNAPGLAISRAFGDYCLKDFGLISVPDVTQKKLTTRDQFVILATDGVWDVISNQEAVKIVASTPHKEKAAQRLVNCATNEWKRKRRGIAIDDISAICLFFHSSPSHQLPNTKSIVVIALVSTSSSSCSTMIITATPSTLHFQLSLASRASRQRATFSIFSTLSLSKTAMSSAPLRSSSPTSHQPPAVTELNDESDFESLLSPDGYISICGFGSLLSERSARSTFPDLVNFRIVRLNQFRRVFAHVAPVFFERGIAKPETMEISSLSVEPCEGETLVVTVFEIRKSEIPDFIKREVEFRFLAVFPEMLDGKSFDFPAVLCARYSDEEYFNIRCKGSKEIYFQQYGRWNIDKIWRDDVLPCRVYLRHCVLAAKNLGETAYNNFLDNTYLADRKTTIREYLATTGAGIMEEQPPESLKYRYGG